MTTLPPESWSERDLASYVAKVARLGGFLRYHTHDSRRSTLGFPDEVLLHPRRGVLAFRELKSESGRATAEQLRWLAALNAVGADAAIWRPSGLDEIEAFLVGDRLRRER